MLTWGSEWMAVSYCSEWFMRVLSSLYCMVNAPWWCCRFQLVTSFLTCMTPEDPLDKKIMRVLLYTLSDML
jgi:hypothetical protein